MLRKHIILGLILLMIISMASISFASTDLLNTDGLENGSITINNTSGNEYRVLISKDNNRDVYSLYETTKISLKMGNGDYAIRIYEIINGSYKLHVNTTITLNLQNQSIMYLNSVKNINWNTEMVAIQLAAKLTDGLVTDMEKINAIHTYIISNISYDYTKARTVKVGYLPSIDTTIEDGNGICYDYASLFASMLRSVGIPTKLTIGHVGSLYHAWNEVYLSETDEWMTIDSTTDAIYNKYGVPFELFKTSTMYTVELTY